MKLSYITFIFAFFTMTKATKTYIKILRQEKELLERLDGQLTGVSSKKVRGSV